MLTGLFRKVKYKYEGIYDSNFKKWMPIYFSKDKINLTADDSIL
jgi:hypothetical protein